MPEAITVTFGGKDCFSGGDNYFSLEPGVRPSMGIVTMWDKDAMALQRKNTPHELVIEDGHGGKVTIKGLYIVRTITVAANVDETATPKGKTQTTSGGRGGSKKSRAPGNSIVQVMLEDPRGLWKWKTISGQYNVLKDDGITYIADSAKSSTEGYSLDELLKKCTDALGITVEFNTGIDWVPQNVKWEFTNAAVALQALLQNVGWTIAWDPTKDKYEFIDLADPPKIFKPKGTVVAHTGSVRDVAHDRPAKVRVAVRVLREKFFTFGAVIPHDGLDEKGNEIDTVVEGQWTDAGTLFQEWGTSLSYVNNNFCKGNRLIARKRINLVKSFYRRFFRMTGTDVTKVLPLTPISARVSLEAGFENAIGARAHISTEWHTKASTADGSPKLINVTDAAPPYEVRIVDTASGVVQFIIPDQWHLVVSKVVESPKPPSSGLLLGDWSLDRGTVRVWVPYMKRFSSATDLEADYEIFEHDLEKPNNGETKTFLAPHVLLRELWDSVGGEFLQTNKTELQESFDVLMQAYERDLNQPDPEQIIVAGIGSEKKIGKDVRSIKWSATDGVTTTFDLYTPFGFSAFAATPANRARQFALMAESTRLLNPTDLGGGGNADLGSLDNRSPLLKDHGTGVRGGVAAVGHNHDFFNPETWGLLVASDRTRKKSGKDPCKRGPAQTTQRPTQTTGGQRGTGVQVSGGPSD